MVWGTVQLRAVRSLPARRCHIHTARLMPASRPDQAGNWYGRGSHPYGRSSSFAIGVSLYLRLARVREHGLCFLTGVPLDTDHEPILVSITEVNRLKLWRRVLS